MHHEEKTMKLAECEQLGEVSVCACGTLHVAVGSVTLRLSPEAFAGLVHMCQRAVDSMMRLENVVQPLGSPLPN